METNEDFLQKPVFREFCSLLERRSSILTDQYKWNCLAGGIGYSDELPEECRSDEPWDDPWRDDYNARIECKLRVMRSLWCYRQSIANGNPRRDLEGLWNAVKLLAPNWVGFNPARFVPHGFEDSERFIRDLDEESERFNRELEESNAQNRESYTNYSRSALDRIAERTYFRLWYWAVFGAVAVAIASMWFARATVPH
jgi:hypothetical protein